MKKLMVLFVLNLLIITIIPLNVFPQAKKDLGIRTLTIVSGPVGGSWYPIGAKMGEFFEKDFNLNVTVDIGGSAQNIRRVDAGKDADIGLASTPEVWNAYQGLAPFNKKYSNFNVIGCQSYYYFQTLVREGAGITSWKDFSNKRCAPGPAGTGAEILWRYILEEVGLNYEKIRKAGGTIEFRDYSSSIEAMKDGNLDVMVLTGVIPLSFIEEYLLRNKGYFLPMEEPLLRKITQKYPAYSSGVLPAGVYKGQNLPVPTITYWSVFIARANLPESVVYELTKSLYKHEGEIRGLSAGLKDFGIQDALKWKEIPVHPGAKRYFQEVGIWKD